MDRLQQIETTVNTLHEACGRDVQWNEEQIFDYYDKASELEEGQFVATGCLRFTRTKHSVKVSIDHHWVFALDEWHEDHL